MSNLFKLPFLVLGVFAHLSAKVLLNDHLSSPKLKKGVLINSKPGA